MSPVLPYEAVPALVTSTRSPIPRAMSGLLGVGEVDAMTSLAATAVASLSAAFAVIANAIPAAHAIPLENSTFAAPPGGTSIVQIGVSVPTAGADALS